MSDWMTSAGVAYRFVQAGIPAHSYSVSSSSMVPTLMLQDVVLADLRAAGQKPDRGELIVFKTPDGTVYLKRVIGLPGDKVAFKDHHLWLNGAQMPWEDAGTLAIDLDIGHEDLSLRRETLPGAAPYKIALEPAASDTAQFVANIPEVTVPADQIYVVGDNRDNSMDSRLPDMKPVHIADIVGRIVYRERPNAGWLVPQESVPGLPPR